jgi:hypothetical protein
VPCRALFLGRLRPHLLWLFAPRDRHAALLLAVIGCAAFLPGSSIWPRRLSLNESPAPGVCVALGSRYSLWGMTCLPLLDESLRTRFPPRRLPGCCRRHRLPLATAIVGRTAIDVVAPLDAATDVPVPLWVPGGTPSPLDFACARRGVGTMLHAAPGVVIAAGNALIVQPAPCFVARSPVITMAVAMTRNGVPTG